jgi:aminoglycoside phosphotransferase (APT) family kinase protein
MPVEATIKVDKSPDTESGAQLLARIQEELGCPAILTDSLSGSILNVVYAVRCGERELIAKSGASTGIRREAAVLAMLRETEVAVPHAVLLPANPTFPNDLLLLDVLPGRAAKRDDEVLADAGRSLRQVHDMRLPGFGLVGTGQRQLTGTSDSWAGFLHSAVAEASRTIPVDVMPAVMQDEVAAQLSQHHIRTHLAGIDQGVLLHGDLMPRHVWNDEGRLAGLIDWGDAMVGDPLFDLARFSMASEEAFERFLRGYGGSTPPDERILAFYRMVFSLMALTVECGAGGDWFDAYVSTTRSELGFLHRLVERQQS